MTEREQDLNAEGSAAGSPRPEPDSGGVTTTGAEQVPQVHAEPNREPATTSVTPTPDAASVTHPPAPLTQTPPPAPSPPPAQPTSPPIIASPPPPPPHHLAPPGAGVPPRAQPLPAPRQLAGIPPRAASSTGPAVRPARPAGQQPASRGRRVRLSLRRVDPWSVFLSSVVASFFLGVALVVAAVVLFSILSALGVIDSVNTLIGDVTADPSGTATPSSAISVGTVLGFASVLAAVNVILLTALATLGAFLYNLVAQLTGGVEVTLGDRD